MNQMNKAICLLLAFVLVFGLAVSGNAAEAPAAQESLTDAAEWKPETIEAADEQAVITAEDLDCEVLAAQLAEISMDDVTSDAVPLPDGTNGSSVTSEEPLSGSATDTVYPPSGGATDTVYPPSGGATDTVYPPSGGVTDTVYPPSDEPEVPKDEEEPEEEEAFPVYRLYNPYTHEHLLTGSAEEKDLLVSVGWNLDGIAWNAPKEGIPVYRLYNRYDDWHTYTVSEAERDLMEVNGWTVDGVVSQGSLKPDARPIYRLFNPYVRKNYHMFTAGVDERDMLVNAGWKLEGVAWYAAK